MSTVAAPTVVEVLEKALGGERLDDAVALLRSRDLVAVGRVADTVRARKTDPAPDGVEELEDALVASVRRARSEPEVLAREAMDRYGYPAGFLARYFEKLRYRFGPRERAALFTFLELARDAGELEHIPELRFARESGVRA